MLSVYEERVVRGLAGVFAQVCVQCPIVAITLRRGAATHGMTEAWEAPVGMRQAPHVAGRYDPVKEA